MNIPKEVLVMLAAATNLETLIEEIYETADQYRTASLVDNEEEKEKALNKLTIHIHLFILQQMTKGDFQKAINVINDMNDFSKKMNLFKTENN